MVTSQKSAVNPGAVTRRLFHEAAYLLAFYKEATISTRWLNRGDRDQTTVLAMKCY